MARRSYRAARREAEQEPIEFEVVHFDDTGTAVTEVFTCRGEISTLTLSEFGHAADLDSATPEGAAVLRDIFHEAFGDEKEYRRFYKLVRRIHLPDDMLVDIMGGLIEDFTGRPTQRPSSSPASPSTTGADSRAISLPGGFSTQAAPLSSSG